MIIEEAVLATLKPLPDIEAGEGGNEDDNESPPNRKRKRLSFKKYRNERCGRKRFGGWTDAAINQMIAWCVSIRQDRQSKKYLNMEKAYHLWAGE